MGKQMHMIDNATLASNLQAYAVVRVGLERVIEGWRASLLSHSWLDKGGKVKDDSALSAERLEKRLAVRQALKAELPLERPVLGIGMFDNIEVGSGADILSTLYLEGVRELDVHVRKGQMQEFEAYIL